MSFNPELLGAQCAVCPLRSQREGPPVPSEWPSNPTALVIGEAPGADEVKRGAPFIGKAGLELMSGLAAVGVRRSQIALTNVVCCRPPENEYDKLVHQIQKVNKKREVAGEDLIPTPAQCCRPRLLREIAALPRVIPLGGTAHHAILGAGSIMALRGGPREAAIDLGEGQILAVKALPTLHPAFVMRSRRWRAAFRADLGRAFRWFSSGLTWRDPEVIYAPSPEELRRFLASVAHDPIIVWDVETFAGYQDHFEPMADRLKCIGIGVARGIAAVVPFRSIEGRVYYTPAERPEILKIMRSFLVSPDFKKGGWNCLHAGTRIVLEDGSTMPIEQIVRAKARLRVRTLLLPTGTIGTTEITGWIRETVPDQKWIVVRTKQEKSHSRGLTLTPEHRVFTQRGWVAAGDLRVGDRMHFDEPLLSAAQREAILGTALGDSTIRKSPTVRAKSDAPSLKLYGGHASRKFVQEKIAHLAPHAVLGTPAAKPPHGRFAESTMWPFATANLRQLTEFGPLLFDEDGTRRLRIEALERLGPIGFAWWYMDDGNKNRRPEGDGRFESMHLAACRYPQVDVIAAATWLAAHFGEVHADERGAADSKRRIIHLSVEASKAFAEFIAPHVFPSQRYKLPRGDWPPFTPITPPPPRPCSLPIASVEEWIPPSNDREANTIWCISTATENFFTSFGLVHNSRYYDRMVAEAQLGVTPAPQIDGIMVHRVAEPEMPHNLGYSGSVQTDVHNWKAGHIATTAKSDRELQLYCATDTIVTAMAIPPLVQVARQRKQDHLIPVFHRLQDICVGLHKTGLPVDQAKRREWDRKLLKQADAHRKRIRELSGFPSLNPASFPQIADLLFERLQIAPHHYTNLGDPSTDDDALRAFLSETWGLDEQRKKLVTEIRDFRRVTKRRGVVVRLRPLGEDVVTADDLADYSEDDESPEQRAERLEMEQERKKKGKARAPGLVLPDGRVHADWNPHGTTGWRFSSSNPNLQNLEDKLRDIFVAPPGMLFVACDSAQVELRFVAGLANCKYYIDRFKAKADPHRELCIDVFGEPFLKASPSGQKKLRRCVKELTYSSLYMAEDKTKHEVVTSAEDSDTETLLFPDFTMREVSAFSSAWFRRCPEIPEWWDALLVEWQKNGYLAEPILGLKCDFLDGAGSEGFRNRLANYKPQSGGSGALTHLATFRAMEQIPFGKFGPGTGMVQQGHDSIVFQIPMDHLRWRDGEDTKENPIEREFNYCPPGCQCRANRTARFLEECMMFDGRKYGMDVDFMGEAKIGRTLKAV